MYSKISKFFICTSIVLIFTLVFTSCTTNKKQKAIQKLSDTLSGNHISEITYSLDTAENRTEGNASASKDDYTTKLSIISPEPYSGLGIEYNIKGLPDNVTVHFSGMTASLPSNAVAKINPIASLFADNFASALRKIPHTSVTEYEANGTKGYCASLPYSNSDITVYFSLDGTVPYLIEYSSDELSATLIFDSFKSEIKQNNE